MEAKQQYVIGLVLTAAGMNEAQVTTITTRVRQIGASFSVVLQVPSIEQRAGKREMKATLDLLVPLVKKMPLLDYDALELGPIKDIVPALMKADEVWCVTAEGQAESTSRPGRVWAAAQGSGVGRRFKLLHWWSPPELPVKKKPVPDKPLKGW